ncbi:MAG TPA: LysM peptidoglycan-binding domain-containing protein [Luteibaculaceae bacterium]|nr:LysM peptidoglycan-binding domain-containing protein [Luteibaculaceae bacterium]
MKVSLSLTCLLFALHSLANSSFSDDTVKNKSGKELIRLQTLEKLNPEDKSADYDINPSAPGFRLNWEEADDFVLPRLQKLDAISPFDLVYNDQVKSYIKMYSVNKRATTARILALSQMYFPLFEEELAKHNLPTELKCLAIVESALQARARSHAAAVGLWQFIPSTGKLYGLKMNAHLDERSDPVKATQAACRYLKSLYNIFENWELALAAYNSGPGTVNRAIRLSGGKRTYWEIYDHLPRETRGYVPAFIAVNYVVNYYKDHGIVPVTTDLKYCDFDTVQINNNTTVQAIAALIDEPVETLKFLNPSLKGSMIPGANQPFTFRVPKEKLVHFYRPREKGNRSKIEPETPLIASVETELHRVRKGETLYSIAKQHGLSLEEIKRFNDLASTKLRIGQSLVVSNPVSKATPIKVNDEEADHLKMAEALKPAKLDADLSPYAKIHVVEKGDTLWSIAQKYDGISVAELKKLNNLSNASLKPGQKIIISLGS